MANKIKYTTFNTQNAIKVKNFVLGVNNVEYGPTVITDFWNGITPPNGGYTIYINKGVQGPSIYVAPNSTTLENISRMFGMPITANTIDWITSQEDIICLNMDYPNIVTDGLITLYDVAFLPSYPRGGASTIINDLSFDITHKGTLFGSIEYQQNNKGVLKFDNSIGSPYISISGQYNDFTKGLTICAYLKFEGTFTNERIIEMYHEVTGNNIIFSRDGNSSDLYFNVYRNSTSIGPITFVNGILEDEFAFYSVTLDGTNVTLHRNELYETTNLNMIPNNTTRDKSYIGKSSESSIYFNGQIGCIMIYNRSLSRNEIVQNYNAYISRNNP